MKNGKIRFDLFLFKKNILFIFGLVYHKTSIEHDHAMFKFSS